MRCRKTFHPSTVQYYFYKWRGCGLLEGLIVRLKAEKPHWGARKIRELLVRRLDGDVRVPAKSTIHAVLDRHGLVKRGGGPRHRARGTPLSAGSEPQHIRWRRLLIQIY